MALTDIGVRAQIDGLGSYIGGFDRMNRAAEQHTRALDTNARAVGGFANSLRIGAGAFVGFAVAHGALELFKAGTFGAAQAASNLAESQNKVNVVFEDAAPIISEFAKTANTSIGLSKQAALDATGTFGNMFTQLRFGTDSAADMSLSMVRLAADFASFHNADITEVIAAQTSAFRGEYDAVQRFVPTINAAAVEQRALEITGKATTKALTDQDKALAVHRLLLEGAGKATGDFARTSAGAANSARIIGATFQNLSVQIGERLLPMIEPLIVRFSQWLPGAIDTAIARFDAFGKVVGGIAKIITEGDFTGALSEGLQELFGIEIHEDSGVIAALFKVRDALVFLKDDAIPAVRTALELMSKSFDEATGFVSEHKTAQVVLAGVSAYLAGPLALGAVATAVGTLGGVMKTAGLAIVGFAATISGIGLAFAGVGILVAAFATDFMGVSTTVTQIWELLIFGAKNWWDEQVEAFNGVKGEFELFGQTMDSVAKNQIGPAFDWISGRVAENMEASKQQFLSLVATVGSVVNDIIGLFSGLAESLMRIVPQFAQIGRDIVQGLWNGVSGAWASFKAYLDGLWLSLPQGLRNWLEGKSPSRVFMRIGEDIVRGLELGIITNAGAVQDALVKLVDVEALEAEIEDRVRQADIAGAVERLMFSGLTADEALSEVGRVYESVSQEIEQAAAEAEKAAARIRKSLAAEAIGPIPEEFAELASGIGSVLEAGLIKEADAVQQALRDMIAPDRIIDGLKSVIRDAGLGSIELTESINHLIEAGHTAEDVMRSVATAHKEMQEDIRKEAEASQKAHVEYYQKFVKPYLDEARATQLAILKSQWDIKLREDAERFARESADPLAPFDMARIRESQRGAIQAEQRSRGPEGRDAQRAADRSILTEAMDALKLLGIGRGGLREAQLPAFAQIADQFGIDIGRLAHSVGRNGVAITSAMHEAIDQFEEVWQDAKSLQSLISVSLADALAIARHQARHGLGMFPAAQQQLKPVSFLGGSETGSNVTYNVTANYTNPQEPQSLMLDLQTIALKAGM